MNKTLKEIQKADIKLVIPELGKMIYSSLSKRDNCLVYTIDKGYIECYDEKIAFSLYEYIRNTGFTLGANIIGKIDKIKTPKRFLYRFRLVWSSITRLCTMCKKLDIVIVFPEDNNFGLDQFEYCGNSIGLLNRYFRRFHSEFGDIEEWLLQAFLIQVKIFMEIANVKYSIEHTIRDDLVLDALYRAPYIASSLDKSNDYSTLLDLKLNKIKYNGEDLLSNPDKQGYVINGLYMCGYSSNNIKLDKKEGVFI